ncbi:hypothetical protein SCG7086_BO_00070 [Chlamydiales bacterium SCGC AG-110-P3]|nr:hypothetical protein SCG7086_BO_00070 [Chlamydiales bacterium SCGC AG-110-P3]
MTENKKEESSSQFLPAHITEILRSLELLEEKGINRNAPSAYQRQKRELIDMNKRFRGAEGVFAGAYSQVTDLEKAIAGYQETWQNSLPSS